MVCCVWKLASIKVKSDIDLWKGKNGRTICENSILSIRNKVFHYRYPLITSEFDGITRNPNKGQCSKRDVEKSTIKQRLKFVKKSSISSGL